MIFKRTLFVLIFAIGIVSFGLSSHLRAQEQEQPAPQTEEQLFVEQLQEERVSPKTAALFMDKCLAKIPRKFTPNAHEDFCTCSAAHLRLYFTNGDLTMLDKASERKPGNPAFEKYVTEVIAPCMEQPIVDITYVACVEDRSNSPLISHIPKYCQCVGERLSPFVKNVGGSTILANMAAYPASYKEPLDTLLRSEELISERNKAYRSCFQTYLKAE